MNKLSIIVPVYNAALYLRQCIESLIGQTYTNIEIILINDGSTDESGAICDEYARGDSRIIVIHRANGGQSRARNDGLDRAKGSLIAFVDADDWVAADTYEKVIDIHQKTGADIVMFGYWTVKEGKGVPIKETKHGFMDSDHLFSSIEAMNMLIADYEMQSYLWNKIYAKDLFHNCRFSPDCRFEDLAIMYKLFPMAHSISVAGAHYCYYYRERKGSMVTSLTNKGRIDYLDAVLTRYEELKKNRCINQKILVTSVFLEFLRIPLEYPFAMNKRYKTLYKAFWTQNADKIDYSFLNTSHRLYLKLPFPLFKLLFNGVTKKLYQLKEKL